MTKSLISHLLILKISILNDLGTSCNEVAEVFSFQHSVGQERKVCDLSQHIAASGFYGPQGRVIRMPLAMPDMLDTFESFRFGEEKVTNFEMEGSAIAGIAAHLGHNAGTVCCIIAHRHHKASNPDYKAQVRKLVELCLDKLAE